MRMRHPHTARPATFQARSLADNPGAPPGVVAFLTRILLHHRPPDRGPDSGVCACIASSASPLKRSVSADLRPANISSTPGTAPKAHPARLPLHPSRLRVHCLLHDAADPREHVGVRRGNGDAMA